MSFVPPNSVGLQVLDRTVFPEGATIFREGDSGSRAYILQKGKVDFYKKLDGEKVLVGSVGRGSIFGEMALIDDQPRMASAIVAEPTVCIVISEVLFQRKMAALDPFLAGVLRVLVENIRSIQDLKMKGKTSGAAENTMAAMAAEVLGGITGPDAVADGDNAVALEDDADEDAFEVG